MAPKTKTARSTRGTKPYSSSKSRHGDLFDAASEDEMKLTTAPQHNGVEHDDDESEDESSVDIVMDDDDASSVATKDESEEELERLVFGDTAGFKVGLQDFALDPSGAAYEDESDEDEDETGDIKEVPDQDLFFFDSGPQAVAGASVPESKTDGEEDEEDEGKPAWEDTDDERVVVSLASMPRLRKLRETAEDDTVNGKEYVRRLRKQYQSLYPTPDWALEATGKAKRKRTRTMEDDESEDESVSEMDEDEDDLSTQPLARLLKDADILSRASSGSIKKRKLQSGVVDIQRLKDVSKRGPSAVTSLSFHPTYPLLLSSGPSSTLSLHHVNPNAPTPNPLLTSFHMKRTPFTTTAFHPSPSDARIFLSARRRYFHIWNIATGTVEKISRVYGHQHEQRTMEHFSLSPNGKYMALRGSSRKGGGVINILDATTLQWITQVRIESRGGVADFAWWGSGKGMCIAGKSGEVTEWSVRDGVMGRWMDEGAVGTTIIAVGGKSGRDSWIGGDRWVAVGSSSGVVNVYDRRAWNEQDSSPDDPNSGIPTHPKPLRALDQLTTPTSHLAFSPDGQILCMASRWKHNAMRLVHLPSATVFKNWPNEKTPLGRISAVAWGRPNEEDEKEGSYALLAVGSETGRIRMWDVRS